MSILTRDMVIQAERREMVKVDVTEWGPTGADGNPEPTFIFVRELSGREKDEYEASLVTIKGNKQQMNLGDLRARMAVLVCCDKNGERLFQPEDVEWLTNKSVRPLSRIYNAAKELNDLSNEDEKELLKN